jgi:mono/diheme cytochrome c family protein
MSLQSRIFASSQRGRAAHPLLWTLAAILVVVLGVFAYIAFGPGPMDFASGKHVTLADYKGVNPTGVPKELQSASPIEKGEYLTRAADCMVCHTAKEGTPFAGGRAFVLPFGTLYSTNITADPETGIGHYSDQDFLDALHKGIGKNHTKLYPAMPYASYTYMSDGDALAIKAYLFSLKPVRAAAPANTLSFPFNQRALMSLWAAFFNPDRRFEPNAERGDEWNRGAYLVEAMEHCGECHTPRNLMFALNNRKKFAGEIQAGWRAYNISSDKGSGVGAWSDADLLHYLSIGHADGRGTAAGPMGEAVDGSLSHLQASDVAAMVTYLRSVAPVATSEIPAVNATPASATFADAKSADVRGKQVYEGACAGCHGWSGISPVLPFASLTGTRGVNDPKATNVAQIIIRGAQRHSMDESISMPDFGTTYTDAEIASVANYVTGRFGAQGSSLTADNVAKLRAAD